MYVPATVLRCPLIILPGMEHDMLVLIFFFFQAEDGIRDVAVTGVQTCALPICVECESGGGDGRALRSFASRAFRTLAQDDKPRGALSCFSRAMASRTSPKSSKRSEERRVGKDCSSRGSA